LGIQKYALEAHSNNPQIICQYNNDKTAMAFQLLNDTDYLRNSKAFILPEFKSRIFAKNCICPGTISIIYALFSYSAPRIADCPKVIDKFTRSNVALYHFRSRVYRVKLSDEVYSGHTFKDSCLSLYKEKGIILIALIVRVGNNERVFVNPYKYVIDYHTSYGYVIA